MKILLILGLLFSLGKLPACENHSKECPQEWFTKLEKTYTIDRCRRHLQKQDNQDLVKRFDAISSSLMELSKEELESLLKEVKQDGTIAFLEKLKK